MAHRCGRCDGLIPDADWGPEMIHGVEGCIASLGLRMKELRRVLRDLRDESPGHAVREALDALDAYDV